jgi:hypothetical protein
MKEIATANAYGGIAIGKPKRKGVKEDKDLLSRQISTPTGSVRNLVGVDGR